MSTPHPDALPLAIEALQADRTADDLLRRYRMNDGTVTREAVRDAVELALKLRDAALSRAFPTPRPAAMAKAVKGS